MKTWIALFRGINVGGNNPLPMKALRAMLESAGCSNVRTYIQSGNVVFSESGAAAEQLSRRIGQAVLSHCGFEPKVHLISVAQLKTTVRNNPFPEAAAEPKSLHAYFLSETPKAPNHDAMNEIKADNEQFLLKGHVFYLHAPDGIGRSRLAARAEKLLGVSATARNWRTVSKLLELASTAAA